MKGTERRNLTKKKIHSMDKRTPALIRSDKQRVTAYVARLAPPQRKHIKLLLSIIKSVAPKCEERVSWGMPFFRIDGKLFMGAAAFKAHCDLFPVSARIQKKFARELKAYEAEKSMLKFPLDRKIPTGLVRKLVKARRDDVLAGFNMRGKKNKDGGHAQTSRC